MTAFEEFVAPLTPKLRQIACRYNRFEVFLDEDDLYSEMLTYLWERWQHDPMSDKTESYIVQACYFHLRNYLRKAHERYKHITFEEPAGETGLSPQETVSDGAPGVPEDLEGRMAVEKILNNGLTYVEKEVFLRLTEGFTVREIGRRLRISHTMVVKHKRSIALKVSRDHMSLLV